MSYSYKIQRVCSVKIGKQIHILKITEIFKYVDF